MKIGVDLRPLQEYSRFRGIGKVTYELVKALVNEFPHNQYFLYVYSDVNFAQAPEFVKKGRIIGFDKSVKHYVVESLISKITGKKLVIKEKLDIFLGTDPNKQLPQGDFRKVVIFYDIIPLLFIQHYLKIPTGFVSVNLLKIIKLVRYLFAKRFMIENLKTAAQSDRILAISETTKRDIVDYFNIDPNKVQVMYLAADKVFRKIKVLDQKFFSDKYNIKRPFILYIGGLDYRKNVLGLVKAFNFLVKDNKLDYNLVIIGKDVSRKNMPEVLEIRKFIEAEDLLSKVKLIDFVENDDLIKFYNLAQIFVLPSFYEGYGLPVLEAMRCGTPVACSNISALLEVAGDAVVYFDPNDSKDMAKKINLLIEDQDLKDTLRNRGILRAKKFSWTKAAIVAYESFLE